MWADGLALPSRADLHQLLAWPGLAWPAGGPGGGCASCHCPCLTAPVRAAPMSLFSTNTSASKGIRAKKTNLSPCSVLAFSGFYLWNVVSSWTITACYLMSVTFAFLARAKHSLSTRSVAVKDIAWSSPKWCWCAYKRMKHFALEVQTHASSTV